MVVALLAATTGCETTGLQGSQRAVSGTVVEAGGGDAVEGAIVTIANLEEEYIDQTDATGAYAFEVSIDSTMELMVVAAKQGYRPDTAEVQVISSGEGEIVVPDLRLAAVQAARTGPRSVVLAGVESGSIVVTESGGIESTDITFAVMDSTGLPLDLGSAVEVSFRFGARPGGGEALYPTSATTDESGQATTTLHSGTNAGVVQVIAELSHGGTTIRSQPVSIAIHSGLPDQAHLGVAASTFNLPFVTFGLRDTISAYVGDKYGNIVEQGTMVYFTTTGGIIEGSAATDAEGRASVFLFTSEPYPTHPVYGAGYATITASTADENGQTISAQAIVLMSGESRITNLTPTTFTISNGGSQSFSFTVSDPQGNPLAAGTTITVATTSDAVELTGDTEVTLGDAITGGPRITEFSVTATDANPDVSEASTVDILVTVEGPNRAARATASGTAN